jgi:hypothetical protein
MPKKQKKEPKKRNPLWNHPLLRKNAKHDKLRRSDKRNQERQE